MQIRTQQLELDMEQQTGSKSGKEYVKPVYSGHHFLISSASQQTGSKSGKEYIKSVYCHAAYLTYMQSTSLEKEVAPHSSALAWRIPGKGEPGGLPSMGSHRVGHD